MAPVRIEYVTIAITIAGGVIAHLCGLGFWQVTSSALAGTVLLLAAVDILVRRSAS